MKFIFLILSLFFLSSFAKALTLENYVKRPRLVITIVVDQFRADYLTRYQSQFLKAGTFKNPGGFQFLMQNGAYFPFASYNVLQNMTCPGHAMILTGTLPARFGFSTNDWFDPTTKKNHYCVDDEVDVVSPRILQTTTVGDELKNISANSKVISIALKDRSAVMLGGHRADLVIWVNSKINQWSTSTYYNKGLIPDWVQKLNQKLAQSQKNLNLDDATLASSIYGTEITFSTAIEAIKKEKLGKGLVTDFLAVSLSNHDLLGHALGPNSKEMEELTLNEDRLLSNFLNQVANHISLNDVVIAFTADHGIPPTVELSEKNKLDSGKIDSLALFKNINEALDQKFGSSGKESWISGSKIFHFYLNKDLIKNKKLEASLVEAEAKQALLKQNGVEAVFTRSEYEKGLFPPGELGQQIKNSYVYGISGDFILIPKPFYMEKGSNFVTHMTGYSYDRTVPLILFGRLFKTGVYTEAQVIDLAPTLSYALGILPPVKSEGKVLPIF